MKVFTGCGMPKITIRDYGIEREISGGMTGLNFKNPTEIITTTTTTTTTIIIIIIIIIITTRLRMIIKVKSKN